MRNLCLLPNDYAKEGSRKVVVRITDGVGRGLDAKVTSRATVLR